MFILKKEHQPRVYVPLRALFLVKNSTPSLVDVFSLNSVCGVSE